MKRLLLILLVIIGLHTYSSAQWTSPGNGEAYTMSDLVALSEGAITNEGNIFNIHRDVTISAHDLLRITDEVLKIYVNDALITINGTMTCENTVNRVAVYGDPSFSFRFENATDCLLKKMYFSDGAGIQVIESEVTFDDVKFLYFTRDYCSSTVDFFNCDPVFNNCFFMLNGGSAISSPANGQGSPKIINCRFDGNVTDQVNAPQINLGPGAEDTIFIIGNVIDDDYASWRVGGISISDLMGTGATKVILRDNVVINGRYGYNQQGMNISSIIEGNQFCDNHFEDNPMNGGSGVSIYGYSTDCKAKLRGNTITGNLWGVTSIYLNDIDMGTEDDWGRNVIHDNNHSGILYELYNNSTCDLMAVGNDWGTSIDHEVEERIVHQYDDPSLGLVTYTPFVGYDAVPEFNINDFQASEVAVYSLTGQRMNIESLRPGVYMVVTRHGNEQSVKKVIIK